MEEYYTVSDVAKLLKLGRNKTYRLVNQTDFPKIIIGKSIRIPKGEFEKFMHHQLYKIYKL